jgi:hypothetical protein
MCFREYLSSKPQEEAWSLKEFRVSECEIERKTEAERKIGAKWKTLHLQLFVYLVTFTNWCNSTSIFSRGLLVQYSDFKVPRFSITPEASSNKWYDLGGFFFLPSIELLTDFQRL